MKKFVSLFILWVILSTALATYFSKNLSRDNARLFLPDNTTSGHYQFEERCDMCHDPFMGVKESSCIDCHQDELDRVDDSHPKKKFADPRNAMRLAKIDASNCITCHREHQPETTFLKTSAFTATRILEKTGQTTKSLDLKPAPQPGATTFMTIPLSMKTSL